tara:strand:- start:5 stop:280 length:276 start_codon:yes stop_codon:yes gene_type:complete
MSEQPLRRYYSDFTEAEKNDWDAISKKIDDILNGVILPSDGMLTVEEMRRFCFLWSGQPAVDWNTYDLNNNWANYCLNYVTKYKSDLCFYK